MANDTNRLRTARVTLDGQLIRYWEREAARFDELARHAKFNWTARSYHRKAARARGLAERSRRREAAREPTETTEPQ